MKPRTILARSHRTRNDEIRACYAAAGLKLAPFAFRGRERKGPTNARQRRETVRFLKSIGM